MGELASPVLVGVACATRRAMTPDAQATTAAAIIGFQSIQSFALLPNGPIDLNLNMASLLRSALTWSDIDPGAQTERRGGAGPAGGLLGGKDPAGRLSDRRVMRASCRRYVHRHATRADTRRARRACEGRSRLASLVIVEVVDIIRGTQIVPE